MDTKKLDAIAYRVYHSEEAGAFAKAFADAWLKADQFNKGLLAGSWEKIVENQKLEAIK